MLNKIARLLFVGTIIATYLFSFGEDYLYTWVVYGAYCVVAIAAILSKQRGKLQFLPEVSLFIVFTIFSAISLLWAKYDSNQSMSFLVLMIAYLLISTNLFSTKDDVVYIIKASIISALILGIYSITMYGIKGYISMMEMGNRMGSESIGSNTLGICSSMASVMSIGMYFETKEKKYLLSYAALGFMCFSSGSRMALIVFGMGTLLMFAEHCIITDRSKIKSFVKILLVSVLILVVAYYILKNVAAFNVVYRRIDELIQVLLGRMESTDGVGTNRIRTVLIQKGLSEFKNSPLFGIGYNNGKYLMSGYKGCATYSLHNNFVDILCCGGLFGFLIFYGIYFSLISKLNKKKRSNDMISSISMVLIIVNLISHMSGVFYVLKFYYPWLILWIVNANIENRVYSED